MIRKRMLSIVLTACLLLALIPISSKAASYQHAMWFFKSHLQITNGASGHKYMAKYPYRKPVDFVGPTSGIDSAYAPFDCKVVKIDTSQGNMVAFESTNQVYMADGSLGYVTFMLAHDDNISDLYVGKTFSQGSVIYQEGSTGESSGNHIHVEVAKGRFSTSGDTNIWTFVRSQSRAVLPNVVFYLYPNTTIKATGGYTWKTYGSSSSVSVTVKTGPAEEITATSAKVCGSMWVSGTTPTACGMYLGTTTSNMTKLGSDSISKVVDFWYYTAKAGRTLAAGTTYYCQAYIVAGGKTYWGNYYSFTTKNWVQNNGKWYYYRNGKAVTGWVLDNSSWYYMNSSGVMQTGWLDEGGSRYYLNSSGAMLTGWQTIGGVQYYFDSSGRLVPCKAGHSYGSWTTTKAATCTVAGSQTRKCTRCSNSETQSIAALGHHWNTDFTVDKAATETEPGEKSIHCAVCGERTQITAIPATGGQSEGPSGFVDVTDPASYFYFPVDWAVRVGVTTGTDETHFTPDGSCTRAQAVTFIWRTAGCPEPENSGNPFGDVTDGEYYYKAVLWAVEQGITQGTSDTEFSPNDLCNRAHIVTFLYRFARCPETPGEAFADVPVGAYYYDAVRWAVLREVTNGTGDGLFSPDAICTRGQIVTFLYRDQINK